jgi:hypothetical protein
MYSRPGLSFGPGVTVTEGDCHVLSLKARRAALRPLIASHAPSDCGAGEADSWR